MPLLSKSHAKLNGWSLPVEQLTKFTKSGDGPLNGEPLKQAIGDVSEMLAVVVASPVASRLSVTLSFIIYVPFCV